MKRNNTTSLITIVVVVVVIIAIGLLGGQIISASVTHTVSDDVKEQLLDSLSQTGDRVLLAFPADTGWQRGESGSFALGIRNIYNTQKTYYVNVYLESVGMAMEASEVQAEANSWLEFADSVDVPASNMLTTEVIIRPEYGAYLGAYAFRVAVCEAPENGDCHHISPAVGYTTASASIYGSAQLSFEVQG